MNICVFGDSITWGASDNEKGGWVERLKSYYMKNRDDLRIRVYNLGMSGDDTDDLLKRFESEATIRKPNFIIFAIGINDSQYIWTKDNHRVSLDKFENNISELTKIARKITDKIMFIGLTRVDESRTMPTPWNTERYYDNESIEKYDAVIRKFSEKNRLDYISMKEIIKIADLEEGLHPNSEGHEKMFKAVLEAIDKSLRTQK